MKHALILFLSLCTGLAMAVPVRFTADVARAETHQAAAYRGETLEIEATLTDRGRPLAVADGASATMYWQTNGMASAWWTAPAVMSGGVIRATWSPTNDVGAAAYRVFLGVTSGGLNYRANLALRMVGSPGDQPNALPLPAKTLDFATVSVLHAPWAMPYTAGDNIVITNGVISSTASGGGGGIAEETDPVWAAEKGNYADMTLFAGVEAKAVAAETGANLAMARSEAALATAQTKADAADLADKPSRTEVVDLIGGTNHLMRLAGGELSIREIDAGGATNELWRSSSGTEAAVSNLNAAVTALASRITALERRPDLTSWGDYAPDGTPNPDTEAMLFVNKPLLSLGSGFSWATSGAYACIAQSGAVAFAGGTNGEFRLGMDFSSNYVAVVQGGSVVVGCSASGFRVADGLAEIDYPYGGGEFPVVWFSGDLIEDTWREVTPVWVDNGDGSATASVSVTGPRGFFRATSSRNMGAYFKSNIPAQFPKGIYGSLSANPVIYDSTITVTSGGHTYRIPAEIVE